MSAQRAALTRVAEAGVHRDGRAEWGKTRSCHHHTQPCTCPAPQNPPPNIHPLIHYITPTPPQIQQQQQQQARQYKTLDVLTQRDRTTGQLVHVLNGSQRFSEGYLIKSVAVKGLALEDGLPPLDDLQRFQAAAQGGGGGGAGDRAGAADLAGLVQSLTTEGEGQGGAAPTRFAKGDLVLVVQGGGRGPG